MAEVLVAFNQRQLDDAKQFLASVKDGVPKAMAGAINDTAANTKVDMSRRIRERVNIKAAAIKEHLKISPHALPSKLMSGVHLYKSDRIFLKEFGAKQIGSGVTYKIEVGGARKTILHAFGPKIEKLGYQVVTRTGRFHIAKTGRYAGKRREIVSVGKRGTEAVSVFIRHNMIQPTEKKTADDLEKNLNQRIKFLLLKQAGAI